MPGLFDGMRIATSGIRTHRIMEEVVGQNIANASNENYTRQRVNLDTMGSVYDGRNFLGQGVDAEEIIRIRDELLDGQLRDSKSTNAQLAKELVWLEKVQSVFNEPSDSGINATLSQFWEAWSELAGDSQSLATRSNVLARTKNLTRLLNTTDQKLDRYVQDLDLEVKTEVKEINALTNEIAKLNHDIFDIEAGASSKANDLRDRRDAAIDKLSEHADITYWTASNGMINVDVAGHPAVVEREAESLVTKNNPLDQSELLVMWEYGDRLGEVSTGSMAGVLNARDTLIPNARTGLDEIANLVITEVNKVYSNGVGLDSHTTLESNLGLAALGVNSPTDSLSLVPSGEVREMHLSFYDTNGKLVRSNGIVIDSNDSLQDIAGKLNMIKGLDASVITDTENNGRLNITMDHVSGENVHGETSFSLTNNTGGYDSSGVLSLLGFDQTAKSTNTSAVQPVVASRDLTELQTVLGEPSIAAVRSKALNMSGTFTINGFETGTENTPETNGIHVQQLAIEVVSTDSIDSIMAKVNALTAQHGIAMTFNGGTNQLELTSTARTDTEGNVVTAGGTDYLRLSFANDYRFPADPNDKPPTAYTGYADNSNLFATMQMNTLFTGTGAGDIAVDSKIVNGTDLHAGYSLAAGDNQLALDLNRIQHSRIATGDQFTIGEQYADYIAEVGTQVAHTRTLSENAEIQTQSYLTERNSISGVSLDEEMALMIQFQRGYESNARMFKTFNELTQELLNMI